MYLKKVELKGFKSFANKLELDFKGGIIAIVGPNGSGKSNIVDAVRWVLGEQSIKTLRGAKTEEVIFSGTETKKPLGFAEVSLYLDNSTKIFNTDFEDVKITRCLYRTGESEYKINDSNCRLKDIYDVFLNTGIGKEGYSIIGQGKIDEILSAKPKDRRSFFEEATGISKSRLDLNETNKKLEDERQNLLRINDIILEIEKQIEPLHNQSEKATVFLEYKEQLKKFELNLFLMDIEKFKKEYDEINTRYESVLLEVEEKNENLEFKFEEKKELNTLLVNIRSEIEKKMNELNKLEMKLEQKKNDKILINEKILNAGNNIESKKELIEKHEKMIFTKTKMIENDNLKFETVIKDLEEKTQNYNKENETLEKSNEMINKKEADLEKIKSDVIDMMNLTFEIKSELQGYDNKLENIEEGRNQVSKQNEEIEVKLSQLEKDKENIVNEKEFSLQNLKNYENELEQKKLDKTELKQNIEKKASEKNNLEKQTKADTGKLETLVSMEKNYEGYNKGVKEVLAAAEKNIIKGIYGTISELISVEEKYEIAIQVALGGRLQNIITQTDEDAKSAVRYLKQNKCGRATFMPLNAEINSRDFDFSKIESEEGYIGTASELISTDSKYEKTIKSLVKNVVVMDTIDSATKLSNKFRYAYNIVTLDGEQVNSNGSITGGEYKNQINLLTRAREIEELKVKIENDNTRVKDLETEINSLNEQLESVYSNIDKLEADREEAKLSVMKFEEKLNACIKEINMYSEEIKDDTEQEALYNSQKKMLNELKVEKQQEQKETEEKIEVLKQTIEKEKENIDMEKTIRDAKAAELVEMKVTISALEKEKSLHNDTIRLIEDEIKMLEEEKNSSYELITVYEKEIENLKSEIVNTDDEFATLEVDIATMKKDYDAMKIDLSVQEDKFNRNEEEIQKLQKQKEELSQELYKEENSRNTVSIKLENIRQKLMESYNTDYEEAVSERDAEMSYNMAQTKAREFRSKIASLGNVNVDAIEQYKEISTRYEFLKSQRDDIVKAEEQLEVLTKHLLGEMKTQFEQNLVKINERFEVVFKELFGGGRAYVELTDKENPLESGIEIIVCPPGKKIQNIMLLSGGEKSLVAIALLFGILDLKPSPFCILDEIEAALDEANVTRFADYIKKLSNRTQFLVITHRSGTMEVADYMYGITMEEKGVSKVVSLELGNKDYANDKVENEEQKVG